MLHTAFPKHQESHFTAARSVRDVVIGMADGLTVPFALAAGLAGAQAGNQIIVTAGLAEIVAGAIAMSLGGYLAARTDSEHYESEKKREVQETYDKPEQEAKEVADIFRGYGLEESLAQAVVEAIKADRSRWVDFMMRFELGLEAPDPGRAKWSAFWIGSSYLVGGLVPLAPYMVSPEPVLALRLSVVVTATALLAFGFFKGKMTTVRPWRSAFQTLGIGGAAATVAYLVARIIA